MTNSNSGFFGVDEYVSYGVVSDLDGASQVTCAFLVRPNGTWRFGHYFLSTNSGPIELSANGTVANLTLTALINGGNSSYTATIARPADSTWKFLVFTFDAGVGTWYVDGAPIVTTQFWGGDVALDVLTSPLLIGAPNSGGWPSINLDVFGVWNAFVASAVNVAAMWTGTLVNHPYDTVVGVSTPTREMSYDGTLNSTPAGWTGTAGNHSGASTFAYQAPGPTTDASTQLSISPTTLPNGRVGTVYNQTLTATTEGSGNYTWSVLSGSLPPGVTLSGGTAQTTTIAGTPTTIGSYNFTINVARTGATDGQQAYTAVVIDPGVITITPASLADSTVGATYSETLTATGGTGAPTWSVAVGTLPGGLSLGAATGIISGTPTTIESRTFTIGVSKDGGNYTGTKIYTVNITAAVFAISPTTLPDPTYQDPYSEVLTATGGGAGPYTWSIVAGSLPNGLTLAVSTTTTTTISGTPTVRATFSFTVRVTDGVLTDDQPYTVTVQPTALTILPVAARQAAVGLAYSQTFTATGGPGSPTWSVSAGTPPTGLMFNTATGILSGTPTTIESSTFTITASEGGGDYQGSRAYTVTVNTFDAITPPTAPDGDFGVPYTLAMTSADASGLAHLWSIVVGSLPPGLALDGSTTNTSSIIGTPTSGGTYTFTVGVLIPDEQLYGEVQYTIHVLGGVVVSPIDVAFFITIERLV